MHHGGGEFIDRVASRFDKARELGGRSVGFVMYALLDVISDGYFEAIDTFEQYYDKVADRVFGETPIEPNKHRQWFEMRKALNEFDRIIGPLAEALQTVVAQDLDRFPDTASPYLRDVAGELGPGVRRGRLAAGAGQPHRRCQPGAPRLPPERGDEEGHQLGGDHRRPHAGHRVVRDERALPRLRRDLGRCHLQRRRHHLLGQPLRPPPEQQVALTQRLRQLETTRNGRYS